MSFNLGTDFNVKIPLHWKWQELGDLRSEELRAVISGPFGSNIGSKYFVEKGIPVIRGNNLSLSMVRFVDDGYVFVSEEKANELNTWARENDIIFTAAGTIGQVGIIGSKTKFPKYIISNKQIRVRLDSNKILPLFAYYWLASPAMIEFIQQRNTGSTIPLINLSVVKSLPLPVPPLNEQKRIVTILSALDEKIELNRQTNATLETLAQAIFKEWFVDFYFPGSTGEMQDSELGPIPKGWRVGKLGDACERITKGTTPTTFGDSFMGEGVRFLRAECIQDNIGVDESKSLFISLETHGKLRRSQLAIDDILVTIAGTIGRIGMVSKRILPANINQAIAIIRTDPNILPTTYAFYYFKQQTTKEELLSGVTQSVQANISLTDLSNFRLIVPDKDLLDQFDNTLEGVRKLVENLTEQSNMLIKTRDNLLPKLMSGEIEI